MTDLRVKTALVAGSTSGIGKATAIALAARGAHVPVGGRNEQRANDVVAEIEGGGGSATFRLTTLSDLKSSRDLGRRIRPEWCSGERRCAWPDAHPNDGGSPRGDGESARISRTSRSRSSTRRTCCGDRLPRR